MSFNYQSSCIFYQKKKINQVVFLAKKNQSSCIVLLNLSTIFIKKKKKMLNLSTVNQFKVVFQASVIIGMSEKLYMKRLNSIRIQTPILKCILQIKL
jgi:hypothetical protein